MIITGSREQVVARLREMGIDYDPGPCVYVEVEVVDNRIKRVVCYG